MVETTHFHTVLVLLLQEIPPAELAQLIGRAYSDEDLALCAEELGVMTQAISRENMRLRAGGDITMADTLAIQAIRAMAEAATPGPWQALTNTNGSGDARVIRVWEDEQHRRCTRFLAGAYCSAPGTKDQGREAKANAKFIAAARTIVPALCDEVERLRAEGDADDISEALHDAVCVGDGRPRPDALQHHLAKRGLKIVKVAP